MTGRVRPLPALDGCGPTASVRPTRAQLVADLPQQHDVVGVGLGLGTSGCLRCSLLYALTMRNSARAISRKLISAVMTAPMLPAHSAPFSQANWPMDSKSGCPKTTAIPASAAVRRSSDDPVTATPMTKPTARSMKLPRLMNSLNSAIIVAPLRNDREERAGPGQSRRYSRDRSQAAIGLAQRGDRVRRGARRFAGGARGAGDLQRVVAALDELDRGPPGQLVDVLLEQARRRRRCRGCPAGTGTGTGIRGQCSTRSRSGLPGGCSG
jgi:hypothetical protein